ncbi:S24 family peptidase [Sphingomonas sp. I4]
MTWRSTSSRARCRSFCAEPRRASLACPGRHGRTDRSGAWLVEHPAASYIMRVEGGSMAGAGITDGDLIVVNRAKRARAGSIVVALVHGDRTLKRLKQMDGRYWLVPEADGFSHILVDEYVEIWGVVVGVARKVV